MNKTLQVFFALIGLLFAQAAFACEQPTNFSVPNGKTATEDQMNTAGKNYHQYMVDMQLYQVCLNDDAESERRDSNTLSKDKGRALENTFASRHNSASADMKRTTEAFNKAIEAYQARP